MSYIKIELGGKERGLKFNQLAKEIMQSKGNPASYTQNIYSLFYGGLRGNSFVKEEEPDYTFENVCDWVDEIFLKPDASDIFKQVGNVFTSTQFYQKIIADNQKAEEEEKKRLTEIES